MQIYDKPQLRELKQIRVIRVMKKIIFALCAIVLINACNNKKNAPDVSKIAVAVSIERFDKAFFSLDTNNIVKGLYDLNQKFPFFTNDFTTNILGAEPLSDTSKIAFAASRQFLSSYCTLRRIL